MKKKLIALIIVLVLALPFATACTLNNERDMNQVVATVSTSTNQTDNIYKKDLVNMFMSVGNQYMQQYQMTAGEVVKILLEQLINRRIIIQEADREVAFVCAETHTHTLECHLTTNEKNKAKNAVNKIVNDQLDTYVEELKKLDEDDKEDTTTDDEEKEEEVRAKPTLDKDKEDEKDVELKEVDKDSTDYRKEAFSKLKSTLKKNKKTYDEFYKEELKNQQEQILLEKYQKELKETVKINFKLVEDRFNTMQESQKQEDLFDLSSYDTRLSKVSETSFILTNPKDGYGFVYNLLIGFSDYQAQLLANLKARDLTKEQYIEARNQLLSKIEFEDLRKTWIGAEYEYDFTKKEFGEELFKNKDNITKLPFEGKAVWECTEKTPVAEHNGAHKKPEDCKKGKFVYSDFAKHTMFKGDTSLIEQMKKVMGATTYDDATKTGSFNDQTKMVDNFMDLIYTYGTDTGMFTSYKGYVSSPEPEFNAQETYVEEFADAARRVVLKGAGAFEIVGTDFGWHIILCSQQIVKNEAIVIVESDLTKEGTFTFEFSKAIKTELQERAISDNQTTVLQKFRKDNKSIKRFEDTYKDLINIK